MEIVFHAHHAVISDELRARAERAVHKAAARLHRVVDATVRFEEDGPTRRVEIVLHAPKQPPVVALGEGRLFGPALTAATARLQAQVARADGTRTRARRAAPDAFAAGAAAGGLADTDAGLSDTDDGLSDTDDGAFDLPPDAALGDRGAAGDAAAEAADGSGAR